MVRSDRAQEASLRQETGEGRLLERCRTYWQMAEWEKLCALADDKLEFREDRAKLAALAAVGFAQTGDMERARTCAFQARAWGCNRAVVAQVLVGGAYNTLARAASLRGDEALAGALFEQSVGGVMPQADPVVLGRARNIQEKMRLGQLPEALRAIGQEVRQRPTSDRMDRLSAQLEEAERRLDTLAPPPGQTLPEILKAAARGPDRVPDLPLLICGHHKVGTNFLLPVFKAVAETFSLPLWLKFYDPEPERWQICLHQHSRLEDTDPLKNFRGLRMVRHPMGLVHSAALYHERGSEPWLNIPMERFTGATFWAVSSRESYNVIKDPEIPVESKAAQLKAEPPARARVHDFDSGYDFAGRTYAEMLRSFATIEEKIRFEMRCYSRAVILDMLSFSGDRRFIRMQLEDVTHDRSMVAVQKMVRHLGFSGAPAARVTEIAAQNSQWNKGKTRHATTGVSSEWKSLFHGALLEEFRHLYGWAEQALGYP